MVHPLTPKHLGNEAGGSGVQGYTQLCYELKGFKRLSRKGKIRNSLRNNKIK